LTTAPAKHALTVEPPTQERRPFAWRFVLALIAALIAACVLSPFAAWATAAFGWHFPFPRIFDRTVMATLLVAMAVSARRLRLVELLREGFANPSWGEFGAGLLAALCVIALLFVLARVSGCGRLLPILPLLLRAAKYAGAALLIGVIEEAFFRAFLLGGLRCDWGTRAALIASALVYALAHILRSPAHIYLHGYHPFAGFENLALSAARLGHPLSVLPVLIGLFLLGIVLGEAFILTGRVDFSIGLHAGLVIGAKTWPIVIIRPPPQWLAGPGPVPLIAAPAAWTAAILIAALLPCLVRHQAV
jgi:membrane protease YdiL (CAAX protease family)